MVSGSLLLGKEESYSQILKRFSKFFLVLIVASLIAYVYQHYRLELHDYTIKDFLSLAYASPIAFALWYMYAYLAYLLMLPFLRCLAKNMDSRGFQWLFVMYGLISVLPIFEFIFGKEKYPHYYFFQFFIQCDYLFYPLMGYYIEHRLRPADFTRKRFIIMVAASILSIAATSVMTHWKCTITNSWTEESCQSFINTLLFIPSCTIFCGVKMLFEKYPPDEKKSRLISAVGESTFGLYLIESICRDETKRVFVVLDSYMPTIVAALIWSFVACVFGIVITMLLKKISFVSKFI